jgi:hypothetical protein
VLVGVLNPTQMLHGFRMVLTDPSNDIYYRKSIHETKYFDNLNLLYPWLFEETLGFY